MQYSAGTTSSKTREAAASRSFASNVSSYATSAWERRPELAAAMPSSAGSGSPENEWNSVWKSPTLSWESLRSLIFTGRRRASSRHLYWIFRQLALLLETGVDLIEALELVTQQIKHPDLRSSFESIHTSIGKGVSLGAAIREQSDVLGPETSASLQAGEASGKLAETFRQLAMRMEEETQLRNTIRSALAYPATLLGVSQIVVAVLVWFVLPQFADTFTSMAIDPPLITRLLIDTASFVRTNVILMSIVAIALAVAIVALLRRPETAIVFNKLCFSSPLIGRAVRHITIGQVFITCGQLLKSGIPLLETIRLARSSTRFPEIQSLLDRWESEVLDGRGLNSCMQDYPFLPEGAAAMLMTAEKSGRLDSVLIQAGEHYRNEGTNRLKDLLKLSEPAIILALGVLVGVVVASVLLPMLDIQSAKI